MSRSLNITTWVIQGLLALMIGGSGLSKLLQARWIEVFATWGYPDHFVYLIGVHELVCGVAMFVRPVMSYGEPPVRRHDDWSHDNPPDACSGSRHDRGPYRDCVASGGDSVRSKTSIPA